MRISRLLRASSQHSARLKAGAGQRSLTRAVLGPAYCLWAMPSSRRLGGRVKTYSTATKMYQNATGFEDSDLFQALRRRKEQGPPRIYSANLPPPGETLERFVMQCTANEKFGSVPHEVYLSKLTLPPAVIHGPAPPIDSLTPTTISQVAKRVNAIHEHSILFVRTVYKPDQSISANIIVEDDAGDRIKVSLYNYIDPSVGETVEEALPAGTLLAILCPYMKNAMDNRSAELMLRCDNPDCIIKYDSEEAWTAAKHGHPAPPERTSPEVLLELADNSRKKGWYENAQRLFSQALRCKNLSQQQMATGLFCRAAMALIREQWEMARDDLLLADQLIPDQTMTKHLLLLANFRLGNLDEAERICKGTLGPYDNKAAQNWQATLDRLRQEQDFGNFDLEHMSEVSRIEQNMKLIFQAQGMPEKSFEMQHQLGFHIFGFHADFITPDVELGRDIELPSGKIYRGCMATKDLLENQLVCASKALVKSHIHEAGRDWQGNLTRKLVSLLHRRPNLWEHVRKLSGGPESPDKKPLCQAMDIATVDTIRKINAFDLMTTKSQLEVFMSGGRSTGIRNVIMDDEEKLTRDFLAGGGCALWLNESLFNHSCTPNCSWTQVGDHMFIRAARPIEAGEELCISYVPTTLSSGQRKHAFANWTAKGNGFTCLCPWCEKMRSDDKLRRLVTQTEDVYREFERRFQQGKTVTFAASAVLSESKRKKLLGSFAKYPLHFQHIAASQLQVMHGAILQGKGQIHSAVEAFETAAKIGYHVRGSGQFEWAVDEWRIAGAALTVNDIPKAQVHLTRVWQKWTFWQEFSLEDAIKAYQDLCQRYVLPWCMTNVKHQHSKDSHASYETVLENLIQDVCSQPRKNPSL